MIPVWELGDGDKTVGDTVLRNDYIYDQLAQKLALAGITDQATFSAFAQYLGYSTAGPTPPGGQDMEVSWEPSTLKLGEMLGFFTYGDLPGITKIQFLGTTSVAGIDIETTSSITEVDFPNLVSVDPINVQGGFISFKNNHGLRIVSMPLLSSVAAGAPGFLIDASNTALVKVDLRSLPSLDSNYAVQLSGLTALQSINIGGVVSWDNPGVNNCPSLTDVDVSSWVPADGQAIRFNGDALSAASVELILSRCVLAGVTTCTINLIGGTNAGLASLSAQGQADAATLGAQLTINP